MMMPGDADSVKGRSCRSAPCDGPGSSPIRTGATIVVFLVAILLAALVGLVPPFAFRSILDDAIPNGDKRQITVLAVVVVFAALADAALAIVQRWCSARIGEGLIYDLRVALFAKVQRMPVAFFTRTQTGALIGG